MSHPDTYALPDRTPIQIGEVWENPVAVERATILELPAQNAEGRVVAELLALVGRWLLANTAIPHSSSASPRRSLSGRLA